MFRAVETLFDGSVKGRLFAPAVPGAAVIASFVWPVLVQKALLELLEWVAYMALKCWRLVSPTTSIRSIVFAIKNI